MKTGIFSQVDAELVLEEKETVVGILRAGGTPRRALEIVEQALARVDRLIIEVESEPPLPRPIVCQSGCHYCCYNQVEVSPSEALIIGDYLERRFSAGQKAALLKELEGAVALKSGKSRLEIARLRQELRCPLLRGGRCAVYEVRPMVCRAIHAVEASQCERAFKMAKSTGVEHYSHRREIIGSILKGLLEGCREMGCQAEALDLAQALRDFFAAPTPLEQWLAGERIFRPLIYADREDG